MLAHHRLLQINLNNPWKNVIAQTDSPNTFVVLTGTFDVALQVDPLTNQVKVPKYLCTYEEG